MDFGTQLGALRASQPEVVRLLKQMLDDPDTVQRIGDNAIERWKEGRNTYGDESIYKTEEELIVELEAEMSDSFNYGGLIILKANGWRF